MKNVIEVTNLKKSYPVAKPKNGERFFEALHGISFSVEQGEIFGILGPNGAGKTTTLEIIEGLGRQTEGKVKVLGIDNTKDITAIKQKIGVQLQSSDYFPSLTLGELLDLFSSFYGKNKNRTELLRLVNLEDKENEFVKNLSGGQKQRFTIASSLVNDPEIIFLDEPTTGLDPAARRQLWNLIKDINSRGITIVLTTHYMEEAEYLCHRVAIMDQGKILNINEPQKLIEDVSHTTQVSFLTTHELAPGFFSKIPQVERTYNQYPKIIIELKSLDPISAIVALLKEKHIRFSGFTVRTASLEDVYLDLTGHEYLGGE